MQINPSQHGDITHIPVAMREQTAVARCSLEQLQQISNSAHPFLPRIGFQAPSPSQPSGLCTRLLSVLNRSRRRLDELELQEIDVINTGKHLQQQAWGMTLSPTSDAAPPTMPSSPITWKTLCVLSISMLGMAGLGIGMWRRSHHQHQNLSVSSLSARPVTPSPVWQETPKRMTSGVTPSFDGKKVDTTEGVVGESIGVKRKTSITVTDADSILFTTDMFDSAALAVFSGWNGQFYQQRTLMHVVGHTLREWQDVETEAENILARWQRELRDGGGKLVWIRGWDYLSDSELGLVIGQHNAAGQSPLLDLMTMNDVVLERAISSGVFIHPNGVVELREQPR